MYRRVFLVGAAALAACSRPAQTSGPHPPAAASGGGDPAAVIRPLYARYLTNNPNAPFPDLPDQAPWSASLRQALVTMEARSARSEDVEGLDFDPFVNAQDWQISGLDVATENLLPGSHAVVRARFHNADAQEEVVYDLIWENGGWRVDDMRSGGPPDGWDLRQIAAQG